MTMGKDPLLEEAKEHSRKKGTVSVSYLQRIMRIGYTRAARIVDLMEAEEFCGKPIPDTYFREIIEHTGTPETCKNPDCIRLFHKV